MSRDKRMIHCIETDNWYEDVDSAANSEGVNANALYLILIGKRKNKPLNNKYFEFTRKPKTNSKGD